MGSISHELLAFGCALAVLVMLASKAVRRISIYIAIIAVLWTAKDVFIRTRVCPPGTEMVPLQPVAAGFCSADNRAAVVKIDGQLFLSADLQTGGQATCLDLRFWQ